VAPHRGLPARAGLARPAHRELRHRLERAGERTADRVHDRIAGAVQHVRRDIAHVGFDYEFRELLRQHGSSSVSMVAADCNARCRAR
jgi:hypothetical protein